MWEYSILLFKKKDIWNQLSPRDIIEGDMRNVEFNGNWVSISQVETMNNRELKKKEIIEELEKTNITNPFNLRLVMLTDVHKSDCILLVVGNDIPLLERELNAEIVNNTVYLPNVVSRKKQILPILEKIYKED